MTRADHGGNGESVPDNAKENRFVNDPWIDEYLMPKHSITKTLQAEWTRIRYHVGGKPMQIVTHLEIGDSKKPLWFKQNGGVQEILLSYG